MHMSVMHNCCCWHHLNVPRMTLLRFARARGNAREGILYVSQRIGNSGASSADAAAWGPASAAYCKVPPPPPPPPTPPLSICRYSYLFVVSIHKRKIPDDFQRQPHHFLELKHHALNALRVLSQQARRHQHGSHRFRLNSSSRSNSLARSPLVSNATLPQPYLRCTARAPTDRSGSTRTATPTSWGVSTTRRSRGRPPTHPAGAGSTRWLRSWCPRRLDASSSSSGHPRGSAEGRDTLQVWLHQPWGTCHKTTCLWKSRYPYVRMRFNGYSTRTAEKDIIA